MHIYTKICIVLTETEEEGVDTHSIHTEETSCDHVRANYDYL